MTNYYTDQLEIRWFQVRAFAQPDSLLRIGVEHPENYIWSFDPVIRNEDIDVGNKINLAKNWAGQLVCTDSTAEWESPIVELGWGWKPEMVQSIHDDRRDYSYVTTREYWRGANELTEVASLDWLLIDKNSVIDASCQYVQVKVVYITTDETLTFPLIRSIKLAKKWSVDVGMNVPNSTLKYVDGVLDDAAQTKFWGVELAPLVGSSTPYDGVWTSPVHDFGLSLHPRWASWYAFTPMGTYFDTLLGDNTPHIQIRGSNTAPIGAWQSDQLPANNDPIWGTNGSLKDSWIDIKDRESIPEKIGMVRYAQIRIKFGVKVGT